MRAATRRITTRSLAPQPKKTSDRTSLCPDMICEVVMWASMGEAHMQAFRRLCSNATLRAIRRGSPVRLGLDLWWRNKWQKAV